jgi:hypothetical protein
LVASELIDSPQRPRIGRLRAVTIASTLVATGLVTAAPALATPAASAPAPAAAPSKESVAAWGAAWLATEITANGGYLVRADAPDLTDTALAVIDLQAVGVGKTATAKAIAYLKSQLPTLGMPAGSDNPGALAEVIMAGVSAGQDVQHFGGTGAKNNLVQRLLATGRTSGSDRGLFGAADPTYDGAFRQGLALAALKAAGVPIGQATVAAGISWLTRQQCANGLWTSYRAGLTTPCPVADPATFAGPDTNSTGLAVQGLAAYGKHPRQGATLTSLAAVQSSNGGFSYLAAPHQFADPNSTALSIQTIIAAGGQPTAPRWHTGHQGPFAALASYQVRCGGSVDQQGGFFYPGDSSAVDVNATVQAVLAATGRTLPVAKTTATAAVPQRTCPVPSPAAASLLSVQQAGHAGHCTGGVGVTVAADFTNFGGGVQVRCAPGKPATGIAALQQAGFTVAGTSQYGLAFVCRINGKPTPARQKCLTTPPATGYWAYYQAAKGATSWKYASQGPLATHPAQGSIEGWSFGAGAKMHKTPAQVRQA